MSDIWFTSDEHYGHRNILDFCHRPFADVNDMTERLIENHNKLVKPGDLVYHLGDMFWRTLSVQDAMTIRMRLIGQHFYIKGNHEELIEKSKQLRDLFIWVRDVQNLKFGVGKPNIWLSHYAHEDWNGSHRGSYHLFGHVHGDKPNPVGLKMDVGVDAQNFSPISLEQVRTILEAKAANLVYKYWSCDNKECKHKFAAVDEEPKTCAKCGGTMKLMRKV